MFCPNCGEKITSSAIEEAVYTEDQLFAAFKKTFKSTKPDLYKKYKKQEKLLAEYDSKKTLVPKRSFRITVKEEILKIHGFNAENVETDYLAAARIEYICKELKIERLITAMDFFDEDMKVNFTKDSDEYYGLCPHCGKPISEHLSEKDVKKLNQIAHSKYNLATNEFNTGMCGVVIGTLLLLIALVFFILCFDVKNNYNFRTTGEPFIVFTALSILSSISYAVGIVFLVKALTKKKRYAAVIKDIQNKTFVQ